MNSCDNTGLMLYSLFLFNVSNNAFHLKIVFILYNFLYQVKFSKYFFYESRDFRPRIAIFSGMPCFMQLFDV
jgi:hypothetical protein